MGGLSTSDDGEPELELFISLRDEVLWVDISETGTVEPFSGEGGSEGFSGQGYPSGFEVGGRSQTSSGTKHDGLQRSVEMHLQAGKRVAIACPSEIVVVGMSIESQVTLVVLYLPSGPVQVAVRGSTVMVPPGGTVAVTATEVAEAELTAEGVAEALSELVAMGGMLVWMGRVLDATGVAVWPCRLVEVTPAG